MGSIYNIRDIAGSYEMVGRMDSCDYYLHKALDLAEESYDTTMISNILCSLTDNYIEMEQYDSAKVYLRHLLSWYVDKESESPVYTNASKVYLHEGKIDSALYYTNKVLNNGTVGGKKAAYRNLTRIDLGRGDVAAAKEHFEKYVLYIDSINRITASDALANASAAYDYSQKEQENLLLKEQTAKRDFWIWMLMAAIITLFLLLLLVIIFMRKRKVEEQARSLALQLTINKYLMTMGKKESEINHLKETIDLLKMGSDEKTEFITKFNSIRNHFIDLKNNNINPQPEDWIKLENAINELFPLFNEAFPKDVKIRMEEWRMCWLIKLNIPSKDIAAIMSMSPQGITTMKSRLFSKLMNLKGSTKGFSRDLTKFINSI